MPNIYRVVLVGTFAQKFLVLPGEAKIISVFRRSLYVENTSGQFACIGAWSIGPGPLNALCEFPDCMDLRKKIAAKGRATIQNGFIQLGPSMGIDTSRREEWKPEPLPVDWDFGYVRRSLSFPVERIAKRGPREGLAPLVPYIVSGEEVSGEDFFQETSWKEIADCRNWLSDTLNGQKSLEFSSLNHKLVGLGPGLTPSGDDFWCGVMIALYALGYLEVLGKISSVILNQAAERTNKISCAHLACAARGQGAQALHEMISAMGMADEARLNSALCALDKIGHTSGWDSLAGIVCVFVSVASWKGHRVLV